MTVIFTRDHLRTSVEAATGGKVTVLYDDKGYPSYMAVIPKFNIEDVMGATTWGTGVHPAFKVNGVEKSQLFIGQFQATVLDGRACSLPGKDPTASITFDTAKSSCTAKGTGWHMLTNWEWAAVALWCLKNGFQPRGNTDYGRAHSATNEVGVRGDGGAPGNTSGIARTNTGSGAASWRHDNTFAGVADMVGNVWEWVDGMKLVGGAIFMPADNNYALAEGSWPDTGVKIDSTAESAGNPKISDVIVNADTGMYIPGWKSVTNKVGYTPPNTMYQAAIAPHDTTNPVGAMWVNGTGERMPFRGGSWGSGSDAGPFALYLGYARSVASTNIGFRPAFLG